LLLPSTVADLTDVTY